MSEPRASLPIAVFDSGIGGLTVLHELLVSLPQESYLYLGDTAGFPYGNKPQEWLRPRIAQSTRFLLDRGSKLLVVACNSATSAAADVAREVASEHRVEATPFKVLGVLFLEEVCAAFLPSKKACWAYQFRYLGVDQQYPGVF